MDPLDAAGATGLATWVQVIRDGGFLTLALGALIAGARGWYIWRSQHEQIVHLYETRLAEANKRIEDIAKERDRWMTTAIRGTILAEKATDVHEEVFEAVRTGQERRESAPRTVRRRLPAGSADDSE